ncbi:hypothetical protein, partial [Kingella kingae]|uniref:carbamoyl phosphate synthase preATP-grasp domain-containing protein n=1 Tax=Kingella kingae TaxID=504 RepID=UPI001EE340B9
MSTKHHLQEARPPKNTKKIKPKKKRPQKIPKSTDLKSILIIGAGPIVIGQACEFDYSGAQACKAL